MKRHRVMVRAAAMALVLAAAVATIAALRQEHLARQKPRATPPHVETMPCGPGYVVIKCGGKEHCVPVGTVCCGDDACGGAGTGYQCVRCTDGIYRCLPVGTNC
jgi:hypothetical protein